MTQPRNLTDADVSALLRRHGASAQFKKALCAELGIKHAAWYQHWPLLSPIIERAMREVFA